MDGHLELVGRVERDLAHLLVALPVADNVAVGQFCALEDGGLGGVTVHLFLEDRDSILSSTELSSVAQQGHALKGLPAGGLLVESGAGLILGGVGLHNLVVEPHVGDGHSVLGEGSGLVGTDGGGGSKGLDGLEVLYEAVLGGHPLGGEGETDGDGGEQTLGHVGHDDTDQEDDGVQPVVAEDNSDDEEGDTEEHGDTGDQMDE